MSWFPSCVVLTLRHWVVTLPILSCNKTELLEVIYKTALITCKALKTGQQVYLRDLLHYQSINQPAHTLRSSSQLLLYQLAARINFQSKAFCIAAPTVWNSLASTKSSTTITTFKAHLKTELFAAAYDSV